MFAHQTRDCLCDNYSITVHYSIIWTQTFPQCCWRFIHSSIGWFRGGWWDVTYNNETLRLTCHKKWDFFRFFLRLRDNCVDMSLFIVLQTHILTQFITYYIVSFVAPFNVMARQTTSQQNCFISHQIESKAQKMLLTMNGNFTLLFTVSREYTRNHRFKRDQRGQMKVIKEEHN